VNRAAIPAARHAVGAIALAALAVSANLAMRTPAKPVDVSVIIETPTLGHVSFGAIAVVGTPSYEAVVRNVLVLESAFARCAFTTTRVTIYSHVFEGQMTEVEVLGEDEQAAACVKAQVSWLGRDIGDEFDVMIPVDLVE
jgi:hypothetical protein